MSIKATSYFEGNGTSDNPYLIQSADDLLSLKLPEVGLNGYYFKLTKNLNLTLLASWEDIPFKGVFDGSLKEISFTPKPNKSNYLFESIENSEITSLKVLGANITKQADSSHFYHCATDYSISHTSNSCSFDDCESNFSTTNSSTSCQFTRCNSKKSITHSSESSVFTNCESVNAIVYGISRQDTFIGCVTTKINEGIVIQALGAKISQCKSYGKLAGSLELSTIENTIIEIQDTNPSVKNTLITSSNSTKNTFSKILIYIKKHTKGSSSTVLFSSGSEIKINSSLIISNTNNTKIEVLSYTPSYSDPLITENLLTTDTIEFSLTEGRHKVNTDSIPVSLISQRQITTRLNWDFKNIWEWNETEKKPTLSNMGITGKQNKPAKESILRQQLEANIWLGN